MSFESKYASLIWDNLYTVYIPDQLTLNPDYVRKFGTPSSGNKDVDAMMATNFTMVKIPIIRIAEYHEDGIEIQIPSREDMLKIHKDIELYLSEWRERLTYQINLDVQKSRQMLTSLETLSKVIYQKAKPKEVINRLFTRQQFGIINPLDQLDLEEKEEPKPDYEGIKALIKTRASKPLGRF